MARPLVRIASPLVVAASALLSGAPAAFAVPILQHSGANNPTTEGFTYDSLNSGNVLTGAIVNDNGSGLDAWFVDDNSSNLNGNDYGAYTQGFGAVNQATLLANDFVATMRLRVPDVPTAASGAVLYDVNLGPSQRRFLLYFGNDSQGVFQVRDNVGTLLASAAASTAYRNVQMGYDASAANVDIYIDGVLKLSDFGGIAGSNQSSNPNGRVQFGSAAGVAVGQGNYNLVSIELGVVPEPASLALLGAGGLLMLGRRRGH